MITAWDLASGQREAESLMLDVGTAKRPTGRAYDPEQQAEVDTFDDLFTSPCKIQARNVAPLEQEVGGRTATTVRLELHLPVSSAPLATGDVWTVDVPHALSSVPVGASFRVVAPVGKTLMTARRYEVEEVVA